eukprot:6193725-Pleurochrysis_carterae.AAC.1
MTDVSASTIDPKNALNSDRLLIYGGTAICYGAVGSGRQGYPIRTMHAFIWRLPFKYIYYGIYLERPSGNGRKIIISYSTNNHWSRGAAQEGG